MSCGRGDSDAKVSSAFVEKISAEMLSLVSCIDSDSSTVTELFSDELLLIDILSPMSCGRDDGDAKVSSPLFTDEISDEMLSSVSCMDSASSTVTE